MFNVFATKACLKHSEFVTLRFLSEIIKNCLNKSCDRFVQVICVFRNMVRLTVASLDNRSGQLASLSVKRHSCDDEACRSLKRVRAAPAVESGLFEFITVTVRALGRNHSVNTRRNGTVCVLCLCCVVCFV